MNFVNVRSFSHQHTSGYPARYASWSRLQRFHFAAVINARGEYKSSRKSARTCNSTVTKLCATPQSAWHPKRPYAGYSKGGAHVPSPQTSLVHTGNAEPTSQSRICVGDVIRVTTSPSSSLGKRTLWTLDVTRYAFSTSACIHTTAM